jgi:hypothetical protein
MSRKPKKAKDPNAPTKEQARVLSYLKQHAATIYEDRHGGVVTLRFSGGKIIDSGMVSRLRAKGLLRAVSFDLVGAPQQWAPA